MSYEIKLSLFQGPFDLLLFFIERDELDIRDIPVAKITDDFLAYIKQLEATNLEVASEFILVAATLMQIKAKMLLPRPELDILGNEIDPRDELVRHLMEYKKYKSVVETLSDMEFHRSQMERRGNISDEIKTIGEKNNVESELQDLDLYKLLQVYMKAVEKYENELNKPVHKVIPYPYTIEHQKEYILEMVKNAKKISFEDVIMSMPDKIAIIFNFLSILELLQNQFLQITLGEGFNNFWVSIKES
jgi:segregation and condensation protein A